MPAGPQLGILEVLGDLYFGAVSHIEDAVLENLKRNPDQRYLMLRMHSVTQIDISGIHMLESVLRTYRERGGDVFIVRAQPPVLAFMRSTGFYDTLGADNFLAEDGAICFLFHKVLDPAVCIYECDVRVFAECQNLPKQTLPVDVHLPVVAAADGVPLISPQDLWQKVRNEDQVVVYDVREPREYRRARIPQAHSLPLPKLLTEDPELPRDRTVVLACRTGRRSLRAAHALQQRGYDNIAILEGGLLAWEAAGLLEAVEPGLEPVVT
jgi:SulP family sulfate permease